MKNFEILKLNVLILMIFPSLVFSQQFNPNTSIASIQCSSYTPNNQFDKFIGTWKWTDGSETLEIVLKKEKVLVPFKHDSSCQDILLGFHRYTKNGVIIESTLENINSFQNQKLYSLYSSGFWDDNYNQFVGSFKHSSRNNIMRIKMDYINSTSLKIISFENYEGTRITVPGDPIADLTIDLPVNIILTKQ
ncbi:hypothetical protein NZ698_11635 [Chryseobacterium sp. PBS4-4]|uniref:DUF6705 domain-containing protein n=1 Tax=Chryseobacterium edaphi TaxID=2976532 RepID=A0ABT2W9B3_9FLAO|nr:DUF6705 family protein [Chryseobacterium edaphi]MCU7617852.1 hypothetical protein [Chryseobacterium edaphi]